MQPHFSAIYISVTILFTIENLFNRVLDKIRDHSLSNLIATLLTAFTFAPWSRSTFKIDAITRAQSMRSPRLLTKAVYLLQKLLWGYSHSHSSGTGTGRGTGTGTGTGKGTGTGTGIETGTGTGTGRGTGTGTGRVHAY